MMRGGIGGWEGGGKASARLKARDKLGKFRNPKKATVLCILSGSDFFIYHHVRRFKCRYTVVKFLPTWHILLILSK